MSLIKKDQESLEARKCYIPKMRNYEDKLIKKITFENFSSQKTTNIYDIKELVFKISKNEKDIEEFIKEHVNISLTNSGNLKNGFKAVNLKREFNIGEKLCNLIPKCICYQCSGITYNDKPFLKICITLTALKKHCEKKHFNDLKGCIINYKKPEDAVEIENTKSKNRIMMKIDDINAKDKENISLEMQNKINDHSGGVITVKI